MADRPRDRRADGVKTDPFIDGRLLVEPSDLEALRLRLLQAEATLALIRAEARKGEWGLAALVETETDGLGLPEAAHG